ncbi:MAG: SpoIIE family protein phosphatase [Sumerlaeia bacterium]
MIVQGNNRGKRFELTDKTLVFGRNELADIVIKDTGISKKHCRFSIIGNEMAVTDLESTNGTFLDGARIKGTEIFPIESLVRIGQHVLKHEYRRREDVEAEEHLQEDLSKAVSYVLSLLPHPETNEFAAIDWTFLPSVYLGGDAFGYNDIDEDHFAFYLIDVCGHGVGAAMHSISVINVLRNQSLAKVDFRNPAEVLTGLNHIFQMEDHGDLYFSIWYGVYQKSLRSLRYSSAGHPPSLLVSADQTRAQNLKTKGMAIGAIPKVQYKEDKVVVSVGDVLYIYSDGACEVTTKEGAEWTLFAFQQVLIESRETGSPYTMKIKDKVESISGTDKWDDDFSLVAVEFR